MLGTVRGVPVNEIAPMRRYADQFEVSHGLNLVLVNAVFRRPLGLRFRLVTRGAPAQPCRARK